MSSNKHIRQRQQAEQELFRRNRELLTLQAAGTAIASSLDLPHILNTVTQQLANLLDVAFCAISGWDQVNDAVRQIAYYGVDERWFSSGVGRDVYYLAEFPLTRQVLLDRQPCQMTISQPSIDPGELVYMREAEITTLLMLPMVCQDRVIGLVELLDDQVERTFSEHEISLVQLLANQAAVAVENIRLYEQARQEIVERRRVEADLRQYKDRLEEQVAARTAELTRMNEQLHQEIAERKQMAEALAEERNLLRTLIDILPDFIFVKNSESRILLQNTAAVHYAGATRMEEMVGKTDFDFCPPELAAQYYADEREIIQTGQPLLDREEPFISPMDGSLNWISTTKVPLRDSQGQITGLVGISRDITERKQAEQALQKAHDELEKRVAERTAELMQTNAFLQHEIAERTQAEIALAAEQERLHTLVEHLPEGVVLLDPTQRIVLANQPARDFLALLGRVNVGDRLAYLAGRSIETILQAAPAQPPLEVETREGNHRIFEITTRPMLASSESGGWVMVMREVTEARRAQRQAQQQERLAAVGQLAAGIAHDFNNILTSIIGFAGLVSSDPQLSSASKNDLERIIQQGRRAAHLVRQILDFSRQSVTEKRPVSLVPFLKENLKLLERIIPENIHISLDFEPGDYVVNADPAQLQQALTNLAVNARDAMPGGGQLQFWLSTMALWPAQRPPCPDMPPGKWLVLSVSDTGGGIVAEHQSHIFEPFFTTKEVGKGTGLGLAQVHGIVTQHDGYIDVTSQVGVGTTFTIYLPFQPVPLPLMAEPISVASSPQGRGELILLVEDDRDVLDVTKSMLERLGYRVLAAPNGRLGLAIYEQHRQDIALVLTDITMPEMSGLRLAQALQEQNAPVGIVALTGYPFETEARELRAAGITDWLYKPLTLEQLAEKLSQVLQKRR